MTKKSVIPDRKCTGYSKERSKLFNKVIKIMQDSSLTFAEVAKKLNKQGYATGFGYKHDGKSVRNVCDRIRKAERDGTLNELLGKKRSKYV